MAVSTNIITERVGFDSTTNTSIIKVTVVADYNSGSYNNTNKATGTLNINGNSYNYVGNFGSPTSQSGTSTLYETTIALDHNVTNELNCSTIYNSGVSSGTVGSAVNVTYNGQTSGVYGEYSAGSGSSTRCSITVDEGKHTKITLYDKYGDVIRPGKALTLSKDYLLKVQVDVDNGYSLAYSVANGESFNSNDTITIVQHTLIASKAVIPTLYIEQEVTDYTVYSENCVFEGHGHVDSLDYSYDGAEGVSAPKYTTTGKVYMGQNSYGDEPYRPVYFLKFTTPNFNNFSKSLQFELTMNSGYTFDADVYYWLTSSDENYLEYVKMPHSGNYETTDPNVIVEGRITMLSNDKIIKIQIPKSTFEKNKTYYLVLYSVDGGGVANGQGRRQITNDPVIMLEYYSEPILGSHIEHCPYRAYIDNGENWELYAPYIDHQNLWLVSG